MALLNRGKIWGCIVGLAMVISVMKPVWAATPLYTGVVPVANQSDAKRNAAFTQALTDVLIKVSGNTKVATIPSIAAAIKQAPNWVQSYSYKEGPALALVAQFDPGQINGLLAEAKQPICDGQRLTTLVWLTERNKQVDQLIGSASTSALIPTITADAEQRGIPVIVPLLDLQDVGAITSTALWQYQPEVIRQASARYPHDAILVGRITAPTDTGQSWQGDWTLAIKGAKYEWQTQALDETALIKQSVDKLAGYILANSQDVQPKAAAVLTIYGVSTMADYAKVDAYLQQLAPVAQIQLQTLAPDHVVLQLGLSDTPQALQAAIAKGSMLHIKTEQTAAINNSLSYQVNS